MASAVLKSGANSDSSPRNMLQADMGKLKRDIACEGSRGPIKAWQTASRPAREEACSVSISSAMLKANASRENPSAGLPLRLQLAPAQAGP